MKRSEMVDKCFEIFKQNFEDATPVVITPEVINHVLTIAEEAGMLPPPKKRIIEMKTLSYGLMYKGENPEKFPDTIHHAYTEEWKLEWEPEE